MRRKDREITDFEEIIQIMRTCEICHVAFHDEEYPYVVPMNFGMETVGESVFLYFHGAAEGKKHDLLQKNNKVAFVMENTHGIVPGSTSTLCGYGILFESVMGSGHMSYLDTPADKLRALRCLMDQYHIVQDGHYDFNEKVVEHTAVLKLSVHTLSGKQRKV